jgi:1-acyl-sn-glycerol-3-phosphate acyltransferase
MPYSNPSMQAEERAEQQAGPTIEQPSMEDQVAALVAELSPMDGSAPSSEVVLADVGFDSLACADLAVALEERFGVRLVDWDVTMPRTVREVAQAVERRPHGRPRITPGFGARQGVVKRLAGGPIRTLTRLEVRGVENVPMTGPVIVAANHRSMLDIPVMVVASPRMIYFMGKVELFGGPARRWFFHRTGGFPVRRDQADLRAIDTALALLNRGDAVGIYPEGTRQRLDDALQPFLNGAAWMGLQTGAPIVPCGVKGTARRGWPKRVRVSFGDPIRVEMHPDPVLRRPTAEAITARLFEEIDRLLR